MACPPPSKPVISVSATHDASVAATAASAALPPFASISAPAAAVAGCPAAIPACIRRGTLLTAVSYPTRRPRSRPHALFLGGGWDAGDCAVALRPQRGDT